MAREHNSITRFNKEVRDRRGKTPAPLWALQGQALILVRQIGHQSANYCWRRLGHLDHATEALITSESLRNVYLSELDRMSNLCQLITRFKMREESKGEGAAALGDVQQYASGLVCLTAGDEGPLAAALKSKINVKRDYQPIPFLVNAVGTELNQVGPTLSRMQSMRCLVRANFRYGPSAKTTLL